MDGTLALGFIIAALTAQERANEGSLAIVFMLSSAIDTYVNECPEGCFRKADATERLSIRGAQILFEDNPVGEEVYVGYDLGVSYGAFLPTIGASLTSDGDVWVGAGAKWTTKEANSGPFFIEVSLMPGLYKNEDGPEIGGALQFRTLLGLGYEFDDGGTLSVTMDHRSNAETQEFNPGLETIGLRYAVALN